MGTSEVMFQEVSTDMAQLQLFKQKFKSSTKFPNPVPESKKLKNIDKPSRFYETMLFIKSLRFGSHPEKKLVPVSNSSHYKPEHIFFHFRRLQFLIAKPGILSADLVPSNRWNRHSEG
jgi:hypothetical protein